MSTILLGQIRRVFEKPSLATHSDSSIEIKRQLGQVTRPTRFVANERIQSRSIRGLGVAIQKKSRMIGIGEGFCVQFLEIRREIMYALSIEVLSVSNVMAGRQHTFLIT